ncbi:SusD/RagB family nutrient-binding outer membrane lipoprotein [Rhizosphaericola mali]|uniref:SusD/RagB family nutrient-binding outer membrane lipoprotein n=1 Tax=Rhizosphaericola mali TaxID=2545455 RepID=A0A5P2G6Q9_9BACT|nr:SusD/RagB family nutrient-binding outer membrane lipoprotein [Rhizosphaericola mali]QES90388.1 SusD/RagB family nutrient-binding outer membrane lipoprotein [Rhizosphaericola mali]
MMRKNYKRMLGLFTIGGILLASCSKLTSMNDNPKATTNVAASAVFTYGQKKLVDNYTSPSVSVNVFRTLSQEWTECTYVYAAKYVFTAYTPQSNWWNYLYSQVLNNLEDAKNKWVNTGEDSSIVNNERRITDMLEVYTFNMLTGTFGDIPYTASLNTDIPFAEYDSSQTIYNDLLYRLDTSISRLNSAATAMGEADLFYNGDISKWKKFGASLMMKIAIQLADYNSTLSKSYVTKAIDYGILASNDDNATFTYSSSSTNNINPIAAALNSSYSTRHDFCPAGLLVNYMNTYSDPRRAYIFRLYNDSAYVGGVAGSSNSYDKVSLFSTSLINPTMPGTILDYTTMQFLMAEAVERGFTTGTAATYYNNAITSSIEFWGGSAADATTYLAQSGVAYSSATGTWKQKLGYQKWLANFNNPYDAWTDVRRLGYPNLDTKETRPNNTDAGDFPYRLTYPSNESGSNTTNWETAVSHLTGGADVVTAKLFWIP